MDYLQTEYYGNSLLAWAMAFGVILASIIAARALYWVVGRYIKRLAARSQTQLDDILTDMLEEPLVMLMVALGARYALSLLDMSTGAAAAVRNLFAMVFALIVAWAIVRVYDAVHTVYISAIVAKTDTDLDDQLLPILRNGVRILVIGLGIIVGLNNAGYDVGAVLAGLGIGGLAFALAAQDTVANFFGGVMLFVQRPFTLNDRIKVSDVEGYVRRVGMRSTLVETPLGVRILIPNKYFTENPIYNLDCAVGYFVTAKLHLHPNTSLEQIDDLTQRLRSLNGEIDELAWISPILNEFGIGYYELLIKYGVKRWSPDQSPPFDDHYDKLNLVRNQLMREAWRAIEALDISLILPMKWIGSQRSIDDESMFRAVSTIRVRENGDSLDR